MNELLLPFRACFSRQATFEWFVVIVIGFRHVKENNKPKLPSRMTQRLENWDVRIEKSFNMCFDWFLKRNQNIAKDVYKWYLIGLLNAKTFLKKPSL
jgi:hypothetical protein